MILPFCFSARTGVATTRSELGGRRGAGNRMFCSQKNADSDLSAERPRPLSVVEGPSIELRVPHVPREGPRVELLGCLRVSRNLEKNLAEAPQAPKFFEICHTPLSLKYNECAVG